MAKSHWVYSNTLYPICKTHFGTPFKARLVSCWLFHLIDSLLLIASLWL